MDKLDGVEVITCRDDDEWEAWLADHYQVPSGVWLKIAKKGSGVDSVTSEQALQGALCFGWIDSLRRSLDETYFLQKYSPRKPKGSWSKMNVDRVEALIEAGRMREPGLAEVAAAKADGRWDGAYASQRNATVPDDLAAELARDAKARAGFEALDRTGQYAVILLLAKARTPQSRAARLQRVAAKLQAGEDVS